MLKRLYLWLRPIKSAPPLIWPLVVLTSGVYGPEYALEAELFPENQPPYFKTCAAALMAPSTSAH